MPNGFGRGGGGGGGWGFGFRGSSPPWPYVGIGRGGLPRCGYFLSGAAGVPMTGYPYPAAMPYAGMPTGADPYAYPGAMPYAGTPYAGAGPYAPAVTREQELDFLRDQAQNIKSQLEQIDARIKELETEE